MKTQIVKYNRNNYLSGRSKLVEFLWYFVNVLFFVSPLNPFISLKIFLLRLFGAKIGKGVVIKTSINIKYPWRLKIGNYVWIGTGVWIDNLGDVIIGDNCCLSQGSMLLCGNHNYSKVSFDLIVKNIVLEEGVWIGARGVVCPGVVCKSHSILTVNSVATKNLESYSVYQGNPATKVHDRIVNE